MKKRQIITTALTIAVLFGGVAVVEAQVNVRLQTEQRAEMRSNASGTQEATRAETRMNTETGIEARGNSTTSADAGMEDADSPLRNAGVEVKVRGDVCVSDEDCDDETVEERPGRADVSVRVSGDAVRGWSQEAKEAARTRLEMANEVNTANDFGLRVAMAALDDDSIVEISSDEEGTEVRHKTRMQLLGFIPARGTVTTRANADGTVEVAYPWYSFLAAKADADTSVFSQLAADLQAQHEATVSTETEGTVEN